VNARNKGAPSLVRSPTVGAEGRRAPNVVETPTDGVEGRRAKVVETPTDGVEGRSAPNVVETPTVGAERRRIPNIVETPTDDDLLATDADEPQSVVNRLETRSVDETAKIKLDSKRTDAITSYFLHI